jgi:hypothetical protein
VKGLGHDGPGVNDAGRLEHAPPVVFGGRRNDPVDHGGGKGDFPRDIVGQPAVPQRRKMRHDPRCHLSIGRKVVAGQDRERPDPGHPAQLERTDDQARGTDGLLRMGEIVKDTRVIRIELAARRIVAVALLGDGERDDAICGSAIARNNALRWAEASGTSRSEPMTRMVVPALPRSTRV